MNNTQLRIFVIADDLTGAADTAIQFRTSVRKVRVGFSETMPWNLTLDSQVVQAYDSESRALDSEQAYQKVLKSTSLLKPILHQGVHVYKKVDATLRGNMGAEILAILTALGKRTALLAPAFPSTERTVVDGRLLIHGIPVNETVFYSDPIHPITSAVIADSVTKGFPFPIHQIPLATIRAGETAILQQIQTSQVEPRIFIADAETNEDLLKIARAIGDREEVLPCGSGGLAYALSTLWNVGFSGGSMLTETPATQPWTERHPICEKVMVTVGSAHTMAHQQFNCLKQQVGIHAITLSSTRLTETSQRTDELLQASKNILSAEEDILLIGLASERVSLSKSKNLESTLSSLAVMKLQQWLKQHSHGQIGLVATGGDTALAVCQTLNATAIWSEGEVMSGIPWSRLELNDGEIIFVSKAGALGTANTLVDIVEWMTGRSAKIIECK
ncbi:four-carbon acid sugar kinase family protein [Alicyclobacillaceae bacterium I2511]|nr:four-carbon acid sugar kinase family protein [Alicyclobacillaceae bacterium I2511]